MDVSLGFQLLFRCPAAPPQAIGPASSDGHNPFPGHTCKCNVTHSHTFLFNCEPQKCSLSAMLACRPCLAAISRGSLPREGAAGEAIVLVHCLSPSVLKEKRQPAVRAEWKAARPPCSSLPSVAQGFVEVELPTSNLVWLLLRREADPSLLSQILQRHSRQNEGHRQEWRRHAA